MDPVSADELPDFLSEREMQRIFAGGPQLNPGWVMALVGGHIYHREPDGWHRYTDPPEVIDGPES
jgi:hypothetical protein